MADPVAKTPIYPVRDNQTVTLSITIGESQAGGTDVTFQGAELKTGEVTDLPIGPGQAIRKKILYCLTTVQRKNPASGKTSVKYALKGGVQDVDLTYDDATLSEIDERVVYDVAVKFV